MTNEKPYRPNVGIALFNADGRVLIGHRFKGDGPEIILPGLDWQMPQGGVDEGEDLRDAAMRELWEETSVVSASYLGETGWLTYEFPPYDGPQTHRLAKFRGQRQKWFALRFTGNEREIDVRHPGGSKHKPEFIDWRWEPMQNLPALVVPFKRKVYERVVGAFKHLAHP